MKERMRFLPNIERNFLAFGDEAEPELHIKANEDCLKKLRDMIDMAIKDEECEDEIDGMYVLIMAYPNNRKIKEPKPENNPFELGIIE